jgi:hypothetical protein
LKEQRKTSRKRETQTKIQRKAVMGRKRINARESGKESLKGEIKRVEKWETIKGRNRNLESREKEREEERERKKIREEIEEEGKLRKERREKVRKKDRGRKRK